MPRRSPTTLFEDAVEVPLWLEADRQTPFAERLRRDRAIARELRPGNRVARVRGWWRRIGAGGEGIGARLESVRALVTLVMLAVGSVGGVAVALTAFRYDGTYPVNVVRLLALLVVPQLVLVALTLVTALPPRAPGLGAVQDALRALNPAALAASAFRRLAPDPDAYARLFGAEAGRSTAAGRFAKWQLLYWSQAAAVAFNVAALATGAVLIAFTDLAFGWSTTLAVEPATVKRIADALALPWRTVAPEAVPSLALIERSQYFRLEDGGFAGDASRALAGWWSFTILAVTVYGLLPRLLLLAAAAWRLRRATHALLLDDARVSALLDRMSTPEIETSAVGRDESGEQAEPPRAAKPGRLSGTAGAVIWGRCLTPDEAGEHARRFGLELAAVAEAGGSPELGGDVDAISAIVSSGEGTLLVFTPAWEPPLLEFLDFLSALRERAGSDRSIVVAPVGEAEQAVSDVERETWSRAVGRLADPRLYVETGAA